MSLFTVLASLQIPETPSAVVTERVMTIKGTVPVKMSRLPTVETLSTRRIFARIRQYWFQSAELTPMDLVSLFVITFAEFTKH